MSHSSSSTTCVGASSAGCITELIALGACDVYLTQNPTITFFRFRYNRHTNYAMEAIEQPFNNQVSFGSDVQVTLNRTGDLIYFMYVVIDLPAIYAVDNAQGVCGLGSMQFPCASACDACGDGAPKSNCGTCCGGDVSSSVQEDYFTFDQYDSCTGITKTPWAHWTNAIGQFLVQRACLVIGGQVISTLFSDFMYMWEELAGKPGKRLTELIGKRYTRAQLVADSQEDRKLYVPLPFWFTRTSGNALPLVSLQFHGVQVHVTFADLLDCVQTSACDVMVLKCNSCQPLNQNDLNARLLTTYIYLDIHERDRFATSSFEQLIDQVQYFNIVGSSSQVRMNLNFNHPIIELIWGVKRQCQMNANNWFNYSGKWGLDPIKYVHLRLNNLPRFSPKEGRYFRLVEPYQYHTLIPESFTYCFSFALFPEEPQPSGSMNASRIDNIELIFEMQDDLQRLDENGNPSGGFEQYQIVVFGRNWNILRFREGLAGLSFSN